MLTNPPTRTPNTSKLMLIKIQPDATICRYLSNARFRVSQHPSSGVLKTVTAASGTGHNTGTATSLQRGLSRSFQNSQASRLNNNNIFNLYTTARQLKVIYSRVSFCDGSFYDDSLFRRLSSRRALPTCGALLSQLKRSFSTQ